MAVLCVRGVGEVMDFARKTLSVEETENKVDETTWMINFLSKYCIFCNKNNLNPQTVSFVHDLEKILLLKKNKKTF